MLSLSIQFISTLVTIDRLIFWTIIRNFVLALVRYKVLNQVHVH